MPDIQKIKESKKIKDGWWASLFSGPVANHMLRYIADINWITPNCLTTSSLFLCILACGFIANGSQQLLIIGAILIQFVFILDCMDGQLARYRNQTSNFGAWYDRVTDRIKDFMIYFSIAFGHYRVYADWKIWPLTLTAFFFVYLFDYYVNQDIKLEPAPSGQGQNGKKNVILKFLNPVFGFGEKVYKTLPILQFHIGEQYLLISLFLVMNQTRLFLYIVILLGIFYSVYWPVSKYHGRKPV